MKIKRIRFLAASFTVMLLLNSCAPASEVLPDQAKLFEEMYPQEAERYAELAPVSLTYMNRTSLERHMDRRMVLETVREKMDDPDELRRYLNNIETYNDHKREEETVWIESLSSRLHEDDRLYFFNYKVGDLPPEKGEN